jgi:hypothetical protein
MPMTRTPTTGRLVRSYRRDAFLPPFWALQRRTAS